ncbi:MAG: ABC transporter [Acidobacteria bacterium]|nr:MAG: ABC transporter [Acidobacteriota bacterium]PIE90950.1 MAG: ABC transporter [Acidobacteriota bacterium]
MNHITFNHVSKFYGEVLGVNKVNLKIEPGITSLVGPNGSGKSTIMNLLTGLIQPTQGSIDVMGMNPMDTEAMFKKVAYCTQFDSFPIGMTGYQFVYTFLQLQGYSDSKCQKISDEMIEKVGLSDAAHRKIDAYSKGMRQRIKLAQAMAHNPKVLILDEPLNGLDPMARAETINLFREFSEQELFVIISSHILHEVDVISDQVILINQGYIIAEGQIHHVRNEVEDHPVQFKIRTTQAREMARQLMNLDHIVEITLHRDKGGLSLRSLEADYFYRDFNAIMAKSQYHIESMEPSDEDVNAVYEYLIGNTGGSL